MSHVHHFPGIILDLSFSVKRIATDIFTEVLIFTIGVGGGGVLEWKQAMGGTLSYVSLKIGAKKVREDVWKFTSEVMRLLMVLPMWDELPFKHTLIDNV